MLKEKKESEEKVITESVNELLDTLHYLLEEKLDDYKEDYEMWKEAFLDDIDNGDLLSDIINDDRAVKVVKSYFKSILE